MVHVEDLFTKIQEYHTAVRHAAMHCEYEKITKAREEFKRWCEENKLPIDFTER